MNLPPDQDAVARQRFSILTLVRFSGVALALFGVAILAGTVDLPAAAGYLLLAAGALDLVAIPQVLARAWRSPRP